MTGVGDPCVAYCSAEDVRDAIDVAPGARAARRLPRAILAASTAIEGLLNRRFYPQQDVRYFDWPLNYQYAMPWRLWLDGNEVLDVTRIVTGGTTLLPGTDFILRPENTGPPYSHIEIRLDGHAMWAPGTGTWQQAVAVHGTFGGCDTTEPAATLTAAVTSTTATTVTVTDSATVGTLDTIRVDDEWMTVTAKTWTTTGGTLTTDLPINKGSTTLTPTAGTIHPGETILVDGEKMRVTDVAAGTLLVERAVDGSTLAAHTAAATIYAPRQCTVTRGVLGSTAATHLNAAPVARLAVPDLIRSLAVAEALADTELASMGYTTSKGEDGRTAAMRELNDLRNRAYTRWARQSRSRAV